MTTLGDLDVLALTLWGEARSEPIEGRIAVACVVRNRLALGRWGSSYTSVCRAPLQFSCWNAGPDANHATVMARVIELQTGMMVTDPILRECYWIADGCQSGKLLDRVEGATHYFADSINPPAWARGHEPVSRIGRHLFFVGIT